MVGDGCRVDALESDDAFRNRSRASKWSVQAHRASASRPHTIISSPYSTITLWDDIKAWLKSSYPLRLAETITKLRTGSRGLDLNGTISLSYYAGATTAMDKEYALLNIK